MPYYDIPAFPKILEAKDARRMARIWAEKGIFLEIAKEVETASERGQMSAGIYLERRDVALEDERKEEIVKQLATLGYKAHFDNGELEVSWGPKAGGKK